MNIELFKKINTLVTVLKLKLIYFFLKILWPFFFITFVTGNLQKNSMLIPEIILQVSIPENFCEFAGLVVASYISRIRGCLLSFFFEYLAVNFPAEIASLFMTLALLADPLWK